MNNGFPLVPLGEVLTKSKEHVEIDPNQQYKQVTIKLWGQGVVMRNEVAGSSIAGAKRFVVRPQQFILSRIDARNGAFGLVPDFLDGAVVSNDFPAFTPNPSRVLPSFLAWMSKTRGFIDLCRAASEGTTNRVRMKENLFLAVKIPLPPLPEQQRIVLRIEELVARIEEARGLRRQAVEEVDSLRTSALASVMDSHSTSWQQQAVADVILTMDSGWSPQCDDRPATAGEWGVLKTTSVQWSSFNPVQNKMLPASFTPKLQLRIEAGDVLVTRAGPRKRVGVVAAVRHAQPELMISDKLIRLRPDQSIIDPRFLELSLASPFSQEHLVKRKTGLADAQVNISQSILRSTPVAYPPLLEQQRIVAYLDELQAKVDSLKKLQAETAAELDALLPSVLDRAFKGNL